MIISGKNDHASQFKSDVTTSVRMRGRNHPDTGETDLLCDITVYPVRIGPLCHPQKTFEFITHFIGRLLSSQAYFRERSPAKLCGLVSHRDR
jgi:hypothetical protein